MAEIDFVAVQQNEKLYVQVTQQINSISTEKQRVQSVYWKSMIIIPNMFSPRMLLQVAIMRASKPCTLQIFF